MVEFQPALRAQQTSHELGRAHFQREDRRRLLVLDRRRSGEVEGQRRLSAGRTRRDDDHLARVETVGQLVELREARRYARKPAAARGDRLELVPRRLDELAERLVVLAR